MKPLMDPLVLRLALLLFVAIAAFGLGLFSIRRLRKNLVSEPDSLNYIPLADDGLPVHAYHAVIQQLKQQKSELAAQQLSDRRKAKASDTLSSTILSNLPCGVLFFNSSCLVRQANPAARKLLGFASPVGLSAAELFHAAMLRPANASSTPPPDNLRKNSISPSILGGAALQRCDERIVLNAALAAEGTTFAPQQLFPQVAESEASDAEATVAQALDPALAGKSAVRGLMLDYLNRDGKNLVLEVSASPVLADDASLMGTTLVLTDKTDIESIRREQAVQREVSADLVLALRNSLATIAGYARQLACARDAELARQLADDIAHEAAQLDRTIGGFQGIARAATAGS